MSKFSKSAAFPILIVVILAFFASQLISGPNQKKDPGFGVFMKQLDDGQAQVRRDAQPHATSCRSRATTRPSTASASRRTTATR